MINEIVEPNIPYTLSETAQEAYAKIKALILKIFSLLKNQKNETNLKEEFHKSYVDFAVKLDHEGYKDESNIYMSICNMYYELIDRPNILIDNERFFNDYFKEFDTLLSNKINNPKEYMKKYKDFLKYDGKMKEHYYTTIAQPSSHYNKEVLNEITSYLSGDIDDY